MEDLRNDAKTKIENVIQNKKFCKKIEKSIYEYSIDYCKTSLSELYDKQLQLIYSLKLQTILNNLNTKNKLNNTYLYNAVLNNEIDLTKIAYLSHERLFPDKWKKIKELLDNKEKINKSVAYTEEFECFKCGCNKTTFFQLQTRSGDEPATTFVECMECGFLFKF